jgi:hypothetical protein
MPIQAEEFCFDRPIAYLVWQCRAYELEVINVTDRQLKA